MHVLLCFTRPGYALDVALDKTWICPECSLGCTCIWNGNKIDEGCVLEEYCRHASTWKTVATMNNIQSNSIHRVSENVWVHLLHRITKHEQKLISCQPPSSLLNFGFSVAFFVDPPLPNQCWINVGFFFCFCDAFCNHLKQHWIRGTRSFKLSSEVKCWRGLSGLNLIFYRCHI